MQVDSTVSDLFFNQDHTDAKTYDEFHHFTGFDRKHLWDDAVDFAFIISNLTHGAHDYSPDELVADFLARV